MNLPEDKVLRLVGMAYDAALDEKKWPIFLEAVASAMGSSSAILRSNDMLSQSASFNASIGYDPAWQAAYCKHFVKLDYYNHVMNQYAYAPGNVFSSDQHIDQRELRKTEYCNDYLRPQNKVHAIGTFLLKDDSHSLVWGIQRGQQDGAFGDEEAGLINTLAPHVTRAVQVHRKIHTVTAEKEQAQGALDQMRMGVILTNRFGTPLYLNRAAELMMSQEVGLGIFHNKLAARSPSETAQLLKLIFEASPGVDGAAVGGDMRISMPNKIDFLHCVVTPVSPEISFMMNTSIGTDCVAIFLSRPGGLQLSPKRLVTLYKITPAEARLAARLAALRTVEEAADDLGVSVSTARTQLKSVFGKTGTRSQSELLMLLATGTLAQLGDE
jgi:DNA-binding CsgD family transcriptional regulator/PAS domain-containing protein